MGAFQAAGQSSQNNTTQLISKDYVDPERKVLRLLNQRFELREELGKGAHGRIYSGRDKMTKQSIAVKVVSIKEIIPIFKGYF